MVSRENKNLIKRCVEDISAAFILLTRIPINWNKISQESPDLHRAMWAYPLVGLFVGVLMSAVFFAGVSMGLPIELAILIAMSAAILTTGAFHEDGLADVADGFGGGVGKQSKLEIMRDSRVGTYGSLVLIMAFSFKFCSLQTLQHDDIASAMVIAATLSRLMILVPPLVIPPARSNSLATEAGKPTTRAILVAFLFSIGVSLFIGGFVATVVVVISAFLVAFAFCFISYRQIEGYSGDVLGATQQLSEITILIALATLWRVA